MKKMFRVYSNTCPMTARMANTGKSDSRTILPLGDPVKLDDSKRIRSHFEPLSWRRRMPRWRLKSRKSTPRIIDSSMRRRPCRRSSDSMNNKEPHNFKGFDEIEICIGWESWVFTHPQTNKQCVYDEIPENMSPPLNDLPDPNSNEW